MSGDVLVRVATELPFVLILAVVLVSALRNRTKTAVDTLLFFGSIVVIASVGWILDATDIDAGGLERVSASLLMALPWLLLRIADDVAGVPPRVTRAATVGLAASVAVIVIMGSTDLNALLVLALVGYFIAVQAYCGLRFSGAAAHAAGAVRRRMQAAALGTWSLLVVIAVAGVVTTVPAAAEPAAWLLRIAGVVSALLYLAAFAPPPLLRRAWSEPELRRFLRETPDLAGERSIEALVRALEASAAAMSGSDDAWILLEEDGALRPADPVRADRRPAGRARALAERVRGVGHPLFEGGVGVGTSDGADASVRALVGAPIANGRRVFGVLVTWSRREPLFVEDTLETVALVAQQAAFLLESQSLVGELAEARAVAEVTQLKEDFLSSAAHELRSPVALILAQAQLLERRVNVDPAAPPDPDGVVMLVRASERMAALVDAVLEIDRDERSALTRDFVVLDLCSLVSAAVRGFDTQRHRMDVRGDAALPVRGDPQRLEELVRRLLDNAVKYGPVEGRIAVSTESVEREAILEVTDEGGGVSPAELPFLFERFWRRPAPTQSAATGLGLGLHIADRIAREHAGRIWVTSTPNAGTTFSVALPLLDGWELE